jgi:hypothetical protein
MNISVATKGLSAIESGDFHLVCRLYEMAGADFDVHVGYEDAEGSHRKGRKLIKVLYRISRRHRTYRAGEGNDWLTAFEEDVKAHCFTSLFLNPATKGRGNPRLLASGI